MLRFLPAVLCLGALAAPAWAGPARQGFAGPFEAGLRWVHSAGLAAPWIPTRVSLAAGGELVWIGTEVANRRLLLFDGSQAGVVQPTFVDTSVASASNVLDVAAGAGGQRLFTLLQYPEPDLLHRRTRVTRHDALQAGAGAPFVALWSHDLGFVGNGPARMAVDETGNVVALAALQDSASLVRVEHLDGTTGAVLWTRDLSGGSLEGFALSGDGQVTALGIDQRLVILDGSGNSLHDELLNSPAPALALAADGTRLVLGRVGELRVYDFDGQQYQLVSAHAGAGDEVASRAALSRDGATYAAAWWRFRDPDALRLEIYDGPAHALVNQWGQLGQAGGLQNAPSDLVLTPDGRRAALASWGQGNTEPEVVLLERGVALPVMTIDLPGSALGLDLDPGGTRLVVVTKNLHANQIGSTGEVRLYDTGEGDLELQGPARLGGSLQATSLEAGASIALFLIGTRAAVPGAIPGTQGLLQLDRGLRLRVVPRPADALGRAELDLPLPSLAALSGARLSVQVASRVGGVVVFSESVLDPLFY